MNPFNPEPPSEDESTNEKVSLVKIEGIEVKTSRALLGEIHDKNVAKLDDHFGVTGELFKTIKIKSKKIQSCWPTGMEGFSSGTVFLTGLLTVTPT